MELSQNDSKMLQALSVMAMVWLHLFDRPYEGLFFPIVFFRGIPLSFYMAQLSDFCVFGFAFLSGYAHMILHEQPEYYKRSLKRLLSLFCSYWLIASFFSFVSVITGHSDFMPGSITKFLLNALALNNSYNGAWWYMFTYAVLVFFSPPLLTWIKNKNTRLILMVGFVVYCVAYYARFHNPNNHWLCYKFGTTGMTFFEYVLGSVAFKHSVFSNIYKVWKRVAKPWRVLAAAIILTSLLYGRTAFVPSLFVAPISGFFIMTLFHFWKKPVFVQNVFLFIGNHSTNIWLTHMFFFSVLFKNLVYKARYPLSIYLSISFLSLFRSSQSGLKSRSRQKLRKCRYETRTMT